MYTDDKCTYTFYICSAVNMISDALKIKKPRVMYIIIIYTYNNVSSATRLFTGQ